VAPFTLIPILILILISTLLPLVVHRHGLVQSVRRRGFRSGSGAASGGSGKGHPFLAPGRRDSTLDAKVDQCLVVYETEDAMQRPAR